MLPFWETVKRPSAKPMEVPCIGSDASQPDSGTARETCWLFRQMVGTQDLIKRAIVRSGIKLDALQCHRRPAGKANDFQQRDGTRVIGH